MNEKELQILNLLDNQYKYLARDKDGKLFIYTTKPQKQSSNGVWDISQNSDGLSLEFNMFSTLFVDILWEDSKPFKITRDTSTGE